MAASSEDISDTLNVALACAAEFQAIHLQNSREPGSLSSVALPGLGANTGAECPRRSARPISCRTGYNLFRRRAFDDFAAMRAALEEELGDLGPASPGPAEGEMPRVAMPAAPRAVPAATVCSPCDCRRPQKGRGGFRR